MPPLNEQRRIVSKIEALTARSRRAKEALDAVPALLDKLRQSILASAFRGDLTADWRAKHPDVEPASVLLERIRAERRRRWEEATLAKLTASGKPPKTAAWKEKYQEPEPVDTDGLPELPEGWAWAQASDIVAPDADIVYEIVQPGPPLAKGVPYVRGKDIQNDKILVGQLWRTSNKIAAEYSRSMIKAGDVLLCIIRHLKVAVVPDELDGGNLSRTTSRLRPAAGIQTDYLADVLRSPWCQNWLKSRYRGGTSMPKVNIADACELPIPIAPESEQSQVCWAVRSTLEVLKNANSAFVGASQELASIDATILAKAFRGELLPQDPNDEPASALLEHIRAERESAGATPKNKGAIKKRVG